jgi:acetyl esterase/lipase
MLDWILLRVLDVFYSLQLVFWVLVATLVALIKTFTQLCMYNETRHRACFSCQWQKEMLRHVLGGLPESLNSVAYMRRLGLLTIPLAWGHAFARGSQEVCVERATWSTLESPAPDHQGYWVGTPRGLREKRRILVYFQGGAFALRFDAVYLRFAQVLAADLGDDWAILLAGYRLVPEHRFPAAREDAAAVASYVASEVCPIEGWVAAGDSAGGNLALGLRTGLNVPNRVVALSPWTDLRCSSGSWNRNVGHDTLLTPKLIPQWYAHAEDLTKAEVSPRFAEHTEVPTAFFVGEHELMVDDVVDTWARARMRNDPVTVHVIRHGVHNVPGPPCPCQRGSRWWKTLLTAVKGVKDISRAL